VRRLRMAGLKPYVYFIHGLPGQNAETVAETVKAIRESVESGASRIILYRFQPLPMSAFCDLPMAPPAAKDRLSGQIFKAAQEANRAMKDELVDRMVRVIIAEQYERDSNFLVAYPLRHGPVVLVEGAEDLVGDVVEIAVSGVVSDRIVMGRLRR
jgi:tRNA-2-methylthio-N6-dimethylallyladenosine synthase